MRRVRKGSQVFQMRRGDLRQEARAAWALDRTSFWTVTVTSPSRPAVEARRSDAFEALCVVREQLERRGWRLGLVGAQIDVWPSGMARDQGGGLSAYRWSDGQVISVVDTFEPADPSTTATVAKQQEVAARSLGAGRARP